MSSESSSSSSQDVNRRSIALSSNNFEQSGQTGSAQGCMATGLLNVSVNDRTHAVDGPNGVDAVRRQNISLIEILLVVDKMTVDRHDGDVENFVNTVMSIVSCDLF